jgi:hypothetical protein
MRLKTWKLFVGLSGLAVAVLGCSLAGRTAGDQGTAVAATDPASTDVSQTASDPAELCPTPDASTTLYLSRENGFCFLVPLGIEVRPDPLRPDEMIFLQGPREAAGPKQQETAAVWMQVAQNGPADGLDSAGYAQAWAERYGVSEVFGPPDPPLETVPATLGGVPATILKNLPGMIRMQSAFLVADDVKYQLSLAPQPGDVPELDAAAQQLWDTVTGSIAFFPRENPPPDVRAGDVCPEPTAETTFYSNDRLGLCALLPKDFLPHPEFSDVFVGGPVIGQDPDFGEVRTSVSFGSYGHVGAQTPMDLMAERMEFVQPGTLEEVSLGGYPAVTYTDINGAWPSQLAMILVDGDVYTVLVQPWDETRFPDGVPHAERAWQTLVESLAFYDPWR